MLQLQLGSCLRLSLENHRLPTSSIEMIAAGTVTEDIAPLNDSGLMSFAAVIFEYSSRLRSEVEVAIIPVLPCTMPQSLISIVVFEICFRL
jgi:hypothetical protein